MDRRKFVTIGTTSLCVLPAMGIASVLDIYKGAPSTKPSWLLDLIKINDDQVKHMAAFKVKDPGNPHFGAYFNGAEIINPHSTCGFLREAGCAVSTPESAFYHSPALIKDMTEAAAALLRIQHSDGTIDLMETNFHSPPDTAFMVKRMAPVYRMMKASGLQGADKMLADYATFLKRAGEALITGGIHTPNHRWVVSAALTQLNNTWPDQRYVNRINEWLAEHIDIDPDGQYTEKSTYGYSALVNRVLITIALGMHKPELLDAVRKNLRMMLYYIHPNGEVVTEASNRQDKGQIGMMDNYYYACRYLALLDNDGEMAAMCRLIEKTASDKLTGQLDYFLSDPFLWKELPPVKAMPVSYAKDFPYSGVVRIRRGEWDTTLLANNPGWLTFHKGNAVLQGMRIAASFFGKGQFQSEIITHSGNQWILTKKLEGVYYQTYPKDKIDPNGDLAKMPRSNRPLSNLNHLNTQIVVMESGNGIQIEITMEGTDKVPVSMELIFRRGGNFTGVTNFPGKSDAFLFSEKTGSYTVGNDSIHFGPGLTAHKGIQLRGALPAMEAPTVYITGFTPFKHTIQLS